MRAESNKKNLLLLSSSRAGNGDFLGSAKELIKTFLGEKPLTIAFIPFAAIQKAPEDYSRMVRDALKDIPYKIETVLSKHSASIIEHADVIMTGGGNTFKLLHDLYAYDLNEIIRQRVAAGIPYIGWSAGSNVASPTICTTNDMPVIEPKSLQALRLVPFQINPHYYNITVPNFNGETRDQRLTEFLLLNKNIPVVGLPEGTALIMENNRLTFSGESGIVFTGTDDAGFAVKRELYDKEDLNFLFNE